MESKSVGELAALLKEADIELERWESGYTDEPFMFVANRVVPVLREVLAREMKLARSVAGSPEAGKA